MEIIKEKSVCFTGHRPEKFSSVIGINAAALEMIRSMLFYQIQLAVEDGFEYFISGLARGVDIWAAQYVLELKKKYPCIKLVCAMPFTDHCERFYGNDLWELRNVIAKADDVVIVSDKYSRDCYKKRNYYMVDNASRLIAVVDNYRSGTGQTINYANKKGLDVRIINVKDFASEDSCKKIQNPRMYHFT